MSDTTSLIAMNCHAVGILLNYLIKDHQEAKLLVFAEPWTNSAKFIR